MDGKPEDNKKGTQRGNSGIHLGFLHLGQDCSFMSPPQGRLSYLETSFVMKPLHPLWLRLGDPFMMLSLFDPLPHFFLIQTLCWNILETCCPSLRRGMLQLIMIKQQQLLILRKTSSIQTSFQILLKAQRKTVRRQTAKILSFILLMMGWALTPGGPTELATHQNF